MTPTIPEAAVQAASKRIDEYYDTPNCVGETAVRAALTAALPFLTVVKVTELEWKQEDTSYWRASTSCGSYGVNKMKEGYFEMDGDIYADLEAAKAAAFQDYQSRILSALEF